MPKAPSVRAVGSFLGGTGTLFGLTMPTHAAGDLLILAVETCNQAVSTPPGWAVVPGYTAAGTGVAGTDPATRLQLFFRRAYSAVEAPPHVEDAGDHQIAVIFSVKDVHASDVSVFNVISQGVAAAATTAVSVTGATTTVGNCLILAIVADHFDSAAARASSWANAGLSGLAEILDGGDAGGNGGGISAAAGTKVAAGATGATTATLANAGVQEFATVALRGPDDTLASDACLVSYQNFVDANESYTPTFSGGTWSSVYPLTNLANPRLSKRARTTTDSTTDAQLDVDLKVARDVRVVAIAKHNLSRDALIRIRASSSAGVFTAPLYDSGWVPAYKEIYPSGILQVGHPAYADRKLTLEDWKNPANRLDYFNILSSIVTARYWRIEFDDTSNPDTYVELGRVWLGWAYQPTVNFRGADLGWQTDTIAQGTDGDDEYFDDRGQRREFRFTFENHPVNEQLVFFFDELTRKKGIAQQLLFVSDPTDVEHLQRRSMLCRYKELSGLALGFVDISSTVAAFREWK